MQLPPEIRELARAILTCAPFVRTEADLASVVCASVIAAEKSARARLRKEAKKQRQRHERALAREAKRVRDEIDLEAQEAELRELDKQFSSPPIRQALTALGY